MWEAILAAGVASLGLLLGDLTSEKLGLKPRTIGFIMAIGCGMLMAVVSFSLVEESIETGEDAVLVGVGVALGAIAYFLGDAWLARKSGKDGEANLGMSLAMGALLDGVPESVVIGISAALGGSPSVALVLGAFIANVPEGAAAGDDMEKSGMPRRKINLIWLSITVAAMLAAWFGYTVIGDIGTASGALFNGIAAGALLMVIADALSPEAHERAGRSAGLFVVLGFALGFGLSRAE